MLDECEIDHRAGQHADTQTGELADQPVGNLADVFVVRRQACHSERSAGFRTGIGQRYLMTSERGDTRRLHAGGAGTNDEYLARHRDRLEQRFAET